MSVRDAKAELRRVLRARRAARSGDERARVGEQLAAHAAALGPGPVAAFVGIRGEPPTLPLLAALHARGVRVLLPLLRDDLDLEWAELRRRCRRTRRGAARRAAARRPVARARTASPRRRSCSRPRWPWTAPAAGSGQGGGSYDRALTRTSAPVLAVVFDDELLESVPVEAHDRPVGGTLTPAGGVRRRL